MESRKGTLVSISFPFFFRGVCSGCYGGLRGELQMSCRERTVSRKSIGGVVVWFGYELDKKADFGCLWEHLFSCLITLGIYAPWFYAKVGRWTLQETYIGGE